MPKFGPCNLYPRLRSRERESSLCTMDTWWSRDHVALSSEFVLQPRGTRASQHPMASSSQADPAPGLSDILSLDFVSWSRREGMVQARWGSKPKFQLPCSLGTWGSSDTMHSSEGTSSGCPLTIIWPQMSREMAAAVLQLEESSLGMWHSCPIDVCAFAVRVVVNMCPVSSAKRATQKVEVRTVEEEKQKEVVGVPEPKPVDQIQEKPGIAVVMAKTLCSAFPILYMLVPDNFQFSPNLVAFSFHFFARRILQWEETQPNPEQLLKFLPCTSLDCSSCGEVGKRSGCAGRALV